MLIKFFRSGQGGGSGPVDYLVERDVVAYDQNRNAIRDERGDVMLFAREPLPEVLRGDADRMRALIDTCPHQWTYRAGVIAFTAEDAPSPAQQRQVMDAFENLAFAGLEADQRDMLWVRHTHERRVELHFVTPRMELASGRSLNIAPPGYQKHYDALRDVLNKEHGWNDPMAPERARETVSLIESVRRGDARELIHDWIVQRIETGGICDRPNMTEALTAAGFDLPRTGKNYITVRDPETDERWRLKGDLFREDWTRENTLERALERSSGEPSRSGSRLDAIAPDELRDDWSEALKRAQATIETDIRSFTDANRQHLSEALATTEADVNRLRSMVQPFFLTMGAVAFLIILLSFTASWFWAGLMIDRAQSASLWQLGLQINQTGSGKVLTWDVNRLQLITCQAGTDKTPCLKIAQGD